MINGVYLSLFEFILNHEIPTIFFKEKFDYLE